MNICVLLVPYDSGRHRERMGLGPHHLLPSIEALLTRLGHDVRVDEITLPDPFLAEISTTFALAREIARRVRACREEGGLPIVLSGNCNAAVGTVSGCGGAQTTVVWFDAHGEATTPDTTASGFLDGMGISTLTGRCWQRLARTIPGFDVVPGDRVLLVDARDAEPAEVDLLGHAGVQRLAHPRDLSEAIAPLRPQLRREFGPQLGPQTDGLNLNLYLHLDLDVLDPQSAIANQWPTPGGPTVDDVMQAVSDLCRGTPAAAIGLASYDPAADRDGRAQRAALAILEAGLSGSGSRSGLGSGPGRASA
jgi:arginase